MIDTSTFILIGTWLGSKLADKGFDAVYEKITSYDKIESDFHKSIKKVSKKLQNKYPDILGGSIEHFFRNEIVFNELFKLLFKNAKINESRIEEIFDTSTLPKEFIEEFITSLREELMQNRIFNELLSNNEIYVLINGIGSSLEELVENSEISAKEVSFISAKFQEKFGNEFNKDEFVETYRKNALNNLSQVNFLGLGIDISIKKKRKQLQDIFVKPVFEILEKGHKNPIVGRIRRNSEDIDYEEIFELGDKIVILGNPGSGKSIVVKSIICDILSNKNSSFSNKISQQIPFRVELRNYLAFKKGHHGNILKYLVANLETEFQITKLTEPIVDSILNQSNCILFFDGLDEIFDITDKIETKNDIENFHNSYPKVKSITTSRNIGYSDAALNTEFAVVNIKNFDHEQITEYVTKWYEKEEDIQHVREKEAGDFLNKMYEIDNELISNPLLLSLIVIIYRNILKLPESKLEIYQSCTKTLVDKWDASKNLVFNLDSSLLKEKDKLFADLAYWQYVQLSNKINTNISYEKAKQTISTSIARLSLSDEFGCADLAEDFMEYAEKRSIYFDNNFTHKTFLEYYTAYWIYSNVEKKHKVKERNELIIKYAVNPFWFIVIELLFNLIDKDQGDSDIIDEAITLLLETSPETQAFLLSVIFKLKNISPEVIVNVLRKAILNLLDLKDDQKKDHAVFKGLLPLFRQQRSKSVIIDLLRSFEAEWLHDTNKLITLYILYCEIETPYHSREEFKLLYFDKFDACRKLDAYLFKIALYIFSEMKGHLENLPDFLKSFSLESSLKRFPAIYDLYTIPAYLHGVTNDLVKDENFVLQIEKVKELDISIGHLIHSTSINSIYLTDFEVENLASVLNSTVSEEIEVLIIVLLGDGIVNLDYKMIKDKRKTELIKKIRRLDKKQKMESLKKLFPKFNWLNVS